MTTTWTGRCHCNAVEVRVTGTLDETTDILECNCSICTKKGTLHWIVEPADFELVRGQDALACYQFNTRTAKHFFCRTCGCAPYYIARSHPDKIDVNVRCIDGAPLDSLRLRAIDGQNWEATHGQLPVSP